MPESKAFWVISKVESRRLKILTADLTGGRLALPLFSFAQKAEAYLGPERGSWRIRETAAGELVSVLFGPCAGVGWVLLDPPPRLDVRLLPDLGGVESEAFVERLLGSARTQNRSLPETGGFPRANHRATA